MNWREELEKDYEKKFGLITAGDITLKYTSPKRMWEWITNNIESLLKQQRDENDKLKEALLDARLHFTQKTFSKRPCSTCQLVSDLIKEPFGCNKLNAPEGVAK